MRATRVTALRSLAASLSAAALLTVSSPAHADALVFGYRGGSGGHHHHHPRHFSHRHYARYAQSVVVVPPPRVVYHTPAPAYVPAPLYVPAPVYAPPPVTLVPASPIYQTGDGRYCREYQTVITVDGTARDSYGTACYAPDGTWRIVN